MSRKIIGITVGTPIKPESLIEKTDIENQVEQNETDIDKIQLDMSEHDKNKTIHVTSEDKEKWNSKSDFSGSYNDLTNKPTIPSNPSQIGAEAAGAAESKVSVHNTSETSHEDIRLLITGLSNRLNALADSDDTTLDQMSEVVAYIKSNKSLIDAITTNKVSVSDIIDNLTTNVSNKPLSAKQGVALKALIDAIVVPTLLSQLGEDTTHRTVTDTEKQTWNNKSDFSGKYSDLTGKPTIPSKMSHLEQDVEFDDYDMVIVSEVLMQTGIQSDWDIWSVTKGSALDIYNRVKNSENVNVAIIGSGSDGTWVWKATEIYTTNDYDNLQESLHLCFKSGFLENMFSNENFKGNFTFCISFDGMDNITNNKVTKFTHHETVSKEEFSQLEEQIADYVGGLANHLNVHCPSPQLPANAESGSDFNLHTFADFGAGYHSYFDDLVARYPHYLVREYLGKDASETLPMYRYTLGNRYWNAWYKENYPRMYAWKNGSKIIYSESVSPRIGDVMYEQGYIGATYGGGQPITIKTKPKAVIIRKKRYSLSGGVFKDHASCSAVIFPIFAEGITDSVTVEMTNMLTSSAYTYLYAGTTNEKFETNLTEGIAKGVQSFTVDAPSGGFTESHNYGTFVILDNEGWAGTLDPANATLTVNGIEMELIISTDVADASQASPSKTEQGGTSEGYLITAVSATRRSRTINGLEFVRYTEGDIEPTLLYTELVNSHNVAYGYTYDSNWERQANVSEYGDGTMISGGTTYIRYPYGDLTKDKTEPIHMMIIANEHGGDSEPAIPAVVTARLIRDLCQGRYSDNPVISFIRDNVQLTVIPVVNPHGLNRYAIGEYNGYQNANGININRNYDTPGWDVTKSLGADIDTTDACGDYAGSENETQYVMNTMVDSKAVVAMSVHTISCHVSDHERCNYQGQNPNGAYTQDKIEDMRIDMKTSYNLNFLPYDPLECPPDTTSKSPSFITQCGAYGGIVEFQCHDPLATDEEVSTDASMFTDVVMEQNYSLLLKFIAMWLSDYLEQ